MDRIQFLKNCACTLCSCAAAGVIAPTSLSAEEKKSPEEDWRFSFIKDRYAKLMSILAEQMDEKTLSGILRQLGAHCASRFPLIQQHKGDIAGFIREFKKQANEEITYDPEKGIVTVVGPERGDCYCPLIDRHTTPKVICNCSLGWQQHTYETLLGKKVEVSLKESVVRGGKRCTFEIKVLNPVPVI
jgi:hypothetical protein